jgi:acetyltransferase
MYSFDKLFSPKSIAVIGASTQPGSVGNDVLKNIVKGSFDGEVYPVNPKGGELYGKEVLRDTQDVPEEIDLAIIIVPASAVGDVLEVCGKKKISSVIIISAGFRESGNLEGEKRLIEIAEKYSITLLGPNCLGIINPGKKLNASFAPLTPKKGNIAFLSQSGALCASVLDWAREENLGFSKFVSTGNKAVVDERLLLEYFLEDDETDIIALYVEDLRKSNELIQFLQNAQGKKPIVILKSGRTQAGANASASHTGALVSSDETYDAIFRQGGILRVQDTKELFIAMKTFSKTPHQIQEKALAIITNAGGPGVLASDFASQRGLTLALLDPNTMESLKKVLPGASSVRNPIDVLGDARADRYKKALEIVVSDENVYGVCVILTPQTMTEVRETALEIIKAQQQTPKPIVAVFMGSGFVDEAQKILEDAGVLVAQHPQEGIFILSLLEKQGAIARSFEQQIYNEEPIDSFDTNAVKNIFQNAKDKNIEALPEAYALPVFEGCGFRLLSSGVAKTPQEADTLAKHIKGDVVLKIVSPDILHKTDVGGIRVGVRQEDVARVYGEMIEEVQVKAQNARIDGVMIVQMAPSEGVHMVVGSKRDPSLGPVLMVGLGGIYVEILKDVAFGVFPLSRRDVLSMIASLQSFPLLDGARGGEKMDVEALAKDVMKIAKMMQEFDEIEEIDINPLLVLPRKKGTLVMDSRITLKS